MKHVFVLIAVIAFALSEICAEVVASGIIRGRVVDPEGQPIEAASVFVIEDMDTWEISADAMSDASGNFTLTAPCGNWAIGVSCLGYSMGKYRATVAADSVVDLGLCQLEINARELQQVIVKGTPIAVKIRPDGYTMNVQRIAESSNNTLDLLSRLPQISVKGNKLQIKGKESVIVKINNVVQRVDADQLADVLRGYDASLISSVDVLTTPPLRYDPTGTAAMIVIHTNSLFEKYTGGNLGVEIIKGKHNVGRYGAYGSVVFNDHKLFVDVTPSYNTNSSYYAENTVSADQNGVFYETKTPSTGKYTYIGGNTTLQYQYNKKGFAGVNFNIGQRKTYNHFASEEKLSNYSIVNSNDINIDRPRINATAYIEHNITSQFKCWLETSYYTYKETTDLSLNGISNQEPPSVFHYDDMKNIGMTGVTLANDYSWGVLPNGELNFDFGFKAYDAQTINDRQGYYAHTAADTIRQHDDIRVREVKTIPYVSATYRPTASWYFRAGAQYSLTHRVATSQSLSPQTLRYSAFLPDFIMSWSPTTSSRFTGIVTSATIEPKFEQINPFEWRIQQFSYGQGNLNLRNESSYDYKLVYTYRGSFSTTAYCSQRENAIKEISKVYNGRVYTQPLNALKSLAFGLKPSYYYDHLSWMILSAEAYWGYAYSKSILPDIPYTSKSSEWGANLYAEFMFNPERTLFGYINLDYTGRRTTAISIIEPQYDLGAGVSWFLMQRRLCISLAGMNLIPSAYKGVSTYPDYTVQFNNRYDYPSIYISLSYKFNNIKGSSVNREKMMRNIDQRM